MLVEGVGVGGWGRDEFFVVLGRCCVVGFCWVIVLCRGCGVLVGVRVCGIGCMCGGGVW